MALKSKINFFFFFKMTQFYSHKITIMVSFSYKGRAHIPVGSQNSEDSTLVCNFLRYLQKERTRYESCGERFMHPRPRVRQNILNLHHLIGAKAPSLQSVLPESQHAVLQANCNTRGGKKTKSIARKQGQKKGPPL